MAIVKLERKGWFSRKQEQVEISGNVLCVGGEAERNSLLCCMLSDDIEKGRSVLIIDTRDTKEVYRDVCLVAQAYGRQPDLEIVDIKTYDFDPKGLRGFEAVSIGYHFITLARIGEEVAATDVCDRITRVFREADVWHGNKVSVYIVNFADVASRFLMDCLKYKTPRPRFCGFMETVQDIRPALGEGDIAELMLWSDTLILFAPGDKATNGFVKRRAYVSTQRSYLLGTAKLRIFER